LYWTRTPARNGDVAGFRGDLSAYVRGFSENVRDIFDRFEFAVS
jgi:hypothetical protein